MPLFNYKAINSEGEIVRGLVEESDIDIAYINITDQDLHVLQLRKSDKLTDFYLKKTRQWSIKPKDIIEFAKNLAVSQRAGLPLVTSLGDLAETTDNKHFGNKIADIKRTIELGSGFSDALSKHRDVFPEIFISLIIIGEETGRLSESLDEIAVHLQRMEDLKSAIVRALMYPAFALVGTTGALLFWLVYVLPQMSQLFVSMDMELPGLTETLIAASDFSRNHWYVYIIVPIIIYTILKLLAKNEKSRYYLDLIQLNTPVLKLLLNNKLLALFSEQLRILMNAGVTIDRSLDIMIKVIDNLVFKKALVSIKEEIMLGSRISDTLKKHDKIFPNMVVRMISIGESAGSLTKQLDTLSEHFLSKLDDISDKMGKMLEPIIILVIGSMFLIIILGLLAPIYDLVGNFGQ